MNQFPFGLSLSKPLLHANRPFDELRVNGVPPFGLSLSKTCLPSILTLSTCKLRASGKS
jgi:hypothetical protein